MSKFIKAKLAKAMGSYIKNFSADSIGLSFFKGEGELRNIELNEAYLQKQLHLPDVIVIKRALCNRITAKLSWTRIKTEPVHIFIDRIDVRVEFRTNSDIVVENLDTNKDSETAGGSTPSKYGFGDKVVDGISLHIGHIHMRLSACCSDDFDCISNGNGDRSIMLSLDIGKLQLNSTNGMWQTVELPKTRAVLPSGKELLIYKQLLFESLTITLSEINPSNNLSKKGGRVIPEVFVLDISPVVSHITLKKDISDGAFLAARLDVFIEDITCTLSPSQVKVMKMFGESIHKIVMRYAEARTAVLEKIREDSQQPDMQSLSHRQLKQRLDIRLSKDTDGKVGLVLETNTTGPNSVISIKAVQLHSPAHASGLLAKDIIVAFNGISLNHHREASSLLRSSNIVVISVLRYSSVNSSNTSEFDSTPDVSSSVSSFTCDCDNDVENGSSDNISTNVATAETIILSQEEVVISSSSGIDQLEPSNGTPQNHKRAFSALKDFGDDLKALGGNFGDKINRGLDGRMDSARDSARATLKTLHTSLKLSSHIDMLKGNARAKLDRERIRERNAVDDGTASNSNSVCDDESSFTGEDSYSFHFSDDDDSNNAHVADVVDTVSSVHITASRFIVKLYDGESVQARSLAMLHFDQAVISYVPSRPYLSGPKLASAGASASDFFALRHRYVLSNATVVEDNFSEGLREFAVGFRCNGLVLLPTPNFVETSTVHPDFSRLVSSLSEHLNLPPDTPMLNVDCVWYFRDDLDRRPTPFPSLVVHMNPMLIVLDATQWMHIFQFYCDSITDFFGTADTLHSNSEKDVVNSVASCNVDNGGVSEVTSPWADVLVEVIHVKVVLPPFPKHSGPPDVGKQCMQLTVSRALVTNNSSLGSPLNEATSQTTVQDLSNFYRRWLFSKPDIFPGCASDMTLLPPLLTNIRDDVKFGEDWRMQVTQLQLEMLSQPGETADIVVHPLDFTLSLYKRSDIDDQERAVKIAANVFMAHLHESTIPLLDLTRFQYLYFLHFTEEATSFLHCLRNEWAERNRTCSHDVVSAKSKPTNTDMSSMWAACGIADHVTVRLFSSAADKTLSGMGPLAAFSFDIVSCSLEQSASWPLVFKMTVQKLFFPDITSPWLRDIPPLVPPRINGIIPDNEADAAVALRFEYDPSNIEGEKTVVISTAENASSLIVTDTFSSDLLFEQLLEQKFTGFTENSTALTKESPMNIRNELLSPPLTREPDTCASTERIEGPLIEGMASGMKIECLVRGVDFSLRLSRASELNAFYVDYKLGAWYFVPTDLHMIDSRLILLRDEDATWNGGVLPVSVPLLGLREMHALVHINIHDIGASTKANLMPLPSEGSSVDENEVAVLSRRLKQLEAEKKILQLSYDKVHEEGQMLFRLLEEMQEKIELGNRAKAKLRQQLRQNEILLAATIHAGSANKEGPSTSRQVKLELALESQQDTFLNRISLMKEEHRLELEAKEDVIRCLQSLLSYEYTQNENEN